MGEEVLYLLVVLDQFQGYATELAAASQLDEEGTVKSVSSTWLLSGLTANLNHHIAYSCKTRKYGTLIYRPTTDLLPSLQKAMWKSHLELAIRELQVQTSLVVQNSTHNSDREVLDGLNDHVHTEVKRLLAMNTTTPL